MAGSIRTHYLSAREAASAQGAKDHAEKHGVELESSSTMLTQGAGVYFADKSKDPRQAEKDFKLLLKHLDEVLAGNRPYVVPEKIDKFPVEDIAKFYQRRGKQITGLHWVTLKTMMIEDAHKNYVAI